MCLALERIFSFSFIYSVAILCTTTKFFHSSARMGDVLSVEIVRRSSVSKTPYYKVIKIALMLDSQGKIHFIPNDEMTSFQANTPVLVCVRASQVQDKENVVRCVPNYRWELISRKTMENGREVAKLINDAYLRFAVICAINARALSEVGINPIFFPSYCNKFIVRFLPICFVICSNCPRFECAHRIDFALWRNNY